MKKAFTLLELILIILLISVSITLVFPKNNKTKIDELTNTLNIYLNELRLKALIDNKYSFNETLWYKKRWTLKFFRCRSDVGGFYFSIYSDKNSSGHPSSEDSMKDPLTNKNIYSSNFCLENSENSKYVLLTKNFDIINIEVSCNQTSSLGQISFGNDGKVYSKLSNYENEENEYEIEESCIIKLTDKNNKKREIEVMNKTGYTRIKQ